MKKTPVTAADLSWCILKANFTHQLFFKLIFRGNLFESCPINYIIPECDMVHVPEARLRPPLRFCIPRSRDHGYGWPRPYPSHSCGLRVKRASSSIQIQSRSRANLENLTAGTNGSCGELARAHSEFWNRPCLQAISAWAELLCWKSRTRRPVTPWR